MLSQDDVIPFGHSLVERDQCQGGAVHSSEERRGYGKKHILDGLHDPVKHEKVHTKGVNDDTLNSGDPGQANSIRILGVYNCITFAFV